MKNRTVKIILAVLGGLILIASPFLILAWVFTSGDIPHKSDEELIANFQAHKSDFTQLLQMISEDKELKRVDYYWTSPENPQNVGITKERIDEYRELHRKVGVTRGFSAFSKDYVEFIASSQGLAVSGSSKGYLYTEKQLPNVVQDIDDYRQHPKMSYPVYRHVEGNWYLFFKAD